MSEKEKNKVGRPDSFKEEYIEQAESLALLGLTNEQMAEFFKVNADTFYNWLIRHPKFAEAIKNSKEIADGKVVKSLHKRASGYISAEGKEIPPETTACIFWLKNRQPKLWREKQEIIQTTQMDSEDVNLSDMSVEDLKAYMEILKKYQKKSEKK